MGNKVKELRTERDLSVWDLASKVNASPRQVQRIENGNEAAPLELANTICQALGRPLNWVFPGSTKLLKKYHDQTKSSNYRPVEAAAELRKIGIETDTRRYTFKILLRGHQEPMLFNISPAEEARLFKAVQGESSSSDELSFIVFSTADSMVAINLSLLIFCHFIWDAGIGEVVSDASSDSDESFDDDSDYPIKIFLAHSPDPLVFDAEPETRGEELGERDYFNNIFYMLDTSCMPSDRLHFADGDGESVFIRAGDIALLQVPMWIVDEDEREAMREDEATDESEE